MKKVFIAAWVIATAMQSAAAEEKQTPTDAFRGQTQFQMLTCKLKMKIDAQKIELGQTPDGGTTGDCIKKGKVEAKKAYGPALKAVSKNKEATKLLKDYYASWITAFEGIAPSLDERKIDYERRLAAAEAQYDGLWNRFEIEAGIN